ncbi:hypothetical protein V9O47_004777 [Escherichia coli]|nr:hypothetical protein [Escherichia coli]EEY8997303.1 hypothetical protein [Escherichia coli]EFJ6417130.1 hypothetical protein [Escherichia coli]EFK2541290.1 hypothetical protein [Escherichia coli]EHJ4619926.1 hypothetical protein [Escherichia coli]
MKELNPDQIFSETEKTAVNELNEIANRISKICKEYKIDFVFSFSVLTEVGNNEYKDSRFVSFGLYCETTSPYIHAASEIVDSHIDPQRIQELTLALQLLRENGECNCSDCQHEKKKTTHKTTNQATLH